MMRLAGQKIWITGSGKRLGKTLALACAREGAHIAVHYHHSKQDAEVTVQEIRNLGCEAILVQGDVGDKEAVGRMVDEIDKQWGMLNGLVHSAAVFPNASFDQVSELEFFDTIRTNLFGPYCCTQAALPLLLKASPGKVIFITDAAVEKPHLYASHYMASKGGLETLSKALARELAPNVLVNSIAPGPILKPTAISPEMEEKILNRLPLGRWGSPESVSKALIFLLDSTDLVGETIVVDAGRRWG